MHQLAQFPSSQFFEAAVFADHYLSPLSHSGVAAAIADLYCREGGTTADTADLYCREEFVGAATAGEGGIANQSLAGTKHRYEFMVLRNFYFPRVIQCQDERYILCSETM